MKAGLVLVSLVSTIVLQVSSLEMGPDVQEALLQLPATPRFQSLTGSASLLDS